MCQSRCRSRLACRSRTCRRAGIPAAKWRAHLAELDRQYRDIFDDIEQAPVERLEGHTRGDAGLLVRVRWYGWKQQTWQPCADMPAAAVAFYVQMLRVKGREVPPELAPGKRAAEDSAEGNGKRSRR